MKMVEVAGVEREDKKGQTQNIKISS